MSTKIKEQSAGFPAYNLQNFPVGVDDFLNTFPAERRNEILASIIDLHHRDLAQERWVHGQIRGMLKIPELIFKYVPAYFVDLGFPTSLRATQPVALNDVMEANISTTMEGKMDRDRWYAIIGQRITQIFGEDALSAQELERRKRLYGDPRISTIIRDYLSDHIGVVSFSTDPLAPPMWAHYAENSGFVVGYRTDILRECGVDLRRVLYLELAPSYTPTRDNIVRLRFVDEERRKQEAANSETISGVPLLSHDADLLELTRDWRELSKILFIKGQTWQMEKEARLLVDLVDTRRNSKKDKNGHPIHLLDLPAEAIEEVYVGFNTPRDKIEIIERKVSIGMGKWKLKHTDSHAYRMQVTSTLVSGRNPIDSSSDCISGRATD